MADWQRSALTQNELMSGDVDVVTTHYTRLGEYKVQAGEIWAFGYGPQSSQESAQGRIYMLLKTDDPSELSGYVKISIYGPQNNFIEEVDYFRTEALGASEDRTKMIPFSLREPGVTEDKRLVVEFLPDDAGTVSKEDSTITIDMSRRLIR